MSTLSGVTNTERFWEVYEDLHRRSEQRKLQTSLLHLLGLEQHAASIYGAALPPAPEPLEVKVLKILSDVGGSATPFELEVRSGAARPALVEALRRLMAFGLVTERQVNDQHVVIRLSSAT